MLFLSLAVAMAAGPGGSAHVEKASTPDQVVAARQAGCDVRRFGDPNNRAPRVPHIVRCDDDSHAKLVAARQDTGAGAIYGATD